MFEVKNIKISLKISKLPLNSVINQFEVENIQYKIKNNYIILRNIFLYILFKPKNSEISHVNITGIPNVESISKSIEILNKDILKSLTIVPLEYKIDNLTAVYDHKQAIDQFKILNNSINHYIIKFNKEKFPGLFIKVELGTFIIFHTGKVNLVGCQKISHLQVLFEQLESILDHD
jgi:TATA-box binding protein (TBP) (component of TFIID and TFIIIB)